MNTIKPFYSGNGKDQLFDCEGFYQLDYFRSEESASAWLETHQDGRRGYVIQTSPDIWRSTIRMDKEAPCSTKSKPRSKRCTN